MSYYSEVYKKRALAHGETEKQQHLSMSKQYFNVFLNTSVNKEEIFFNGKRMDVAIMSNKEDGNEITKILVCPIDSRIEIASLIDWKDEFWIVIIKYVGGYEPYNRFIIVKATDTVKWVDEHGVIKSYPAFVRGSIRGTVGASWKITENVIIPLPNKGILAIMQKTNLRNGQRVLVDDEAWKVVERDIASVKGLMYISLEESKIDLVSDNLSTEVANNDLVNSYTVDIGFSSAKLLVGDVLALNPKLYYNGIEQAATFNIVNIPNSFSSVQVGQVVAEKVGTSTIKVSWTENSDVFDTATIVVEASPTAEIIEYKLLGDDNIKFGRTRTYTLVKYINGTAEEIAATFSLNSTLGTITSSEDGHCSILANTSEIGTITLSADYGDGTLEKEIKIIGLWG